jgi:hypothetical protein
MARVDELILIVGSITLIIGSAAQIIAAGRRAAAAPGPGDATVTAVCTLVDYPEVGTTTVSVGIVNPGDMPVLIGLSLRRQGWPGRGTRTMVPSLTCRRRYLAARQAMVGVVPAHSADRLSVVVAARRRCRLDVIVGQSDGRLWVISVPVTVRTSLRTPLYGDVASA